VEIRSFFISNSSAKSGDHTDKLSSERERERERDRERERERERERIHEQKIK
jgi:hypothetical protein